MPRISLSAVVLIDVWRLHLFYSTLVKISSNVFDLIFATFKFPSLPHDQDIFQEQFDI